METIEWSVCLAVVLNQSYAIWKLWGYVILYFSVWSTKMLGTAGAWRCYSRRFESHFHFRLLCFGEPLKLEKMYETKYVSLFLNNFRALQKYTTCFRALWATLPECTMKLFNKSTANKSVTLNNFFKLLNINNQSN